MKNFYYVVTITCETRDQADEVISERIGYDEDYGFNYTIDQDFSHSDSWRVMENIYENGLP